MDSSCFRRMVDGKKPSCPHQIQILFVFLSQVTEPVNLLPYILYSRKVSYTKTRPHSEHSIGCAKTKLKTNICIMASQTYCDSSLNTSQLHAAKRQRLNFYTDYKKMHRAFFLYVGPCIVNRI